MDRFTIGEVARQAGVGIDTVRYYERNHLLPEAPRRLSGYREYDQHDVKRLRFIRRAKELGFTLEEIGDLMSLTKQRDSGIQGVKASAEAKLKVVEAKIGELQRMRRGLQKLITACPGHGPLEACPIIAALNKGELP